jgi:inosine-uridine nucleoside N-ribohydrolase
MQAMCLFIEAVSCRWCSQSLLSPETHGNSGLGYAQSSSTAVTKPQIKHGSDYLIEQIMSHPGEITLVASAR